VYILGHPQTSDIWRQGIMPQTKRLQLLEKTASRLRLKSFRSQEKQCQVSGLVQLGIRQNSLRKKGIRQNSLRLKGIRHKGIRRNGLRWSFALPRPLWRHVYMRFRARKNQRKLYFTIVCTNMSS